MRVLHVSGKGERDWLKVTIKCHHLFTFSQSCLIRLHCCVDCGIREGKKCNPVSGGGGEGMPGLQGY